MRGIVAPPAIVRALVGHGRAQLSTAGGYVAVVVSAGFFLPPPALSADPQVGLVAVDLVAGIAVGGFIGLDGVSGRR